MALALVEWRLLLLVARASERTNEWELLWFGNSFVQLLKKTWEGRYHDNNRKENNILLKIRDKEIFSFSEYPTSFSLLLPFFSSLSLSLSRLASLSSLKSLFSPSCNIRRKSLCPPQPTPKSSTPSLGSRFLRRTHADTYTSKRASKASFTKLIDIYSKWELPHPPHSFS